MSVRKNFSVSIGIGAPSLMTIFLVLSLISFSVLSYMTALADYRFSLNLEERTTAYYTASNLSEDKIADIGLILEDTYFASNKETFWANVTNALHDYGFDSDTQALTFYTPIRETQNLQVTLKIQYPKTETEPLFTITEWIVIQTGEWEPDNTLNLMEVDYGTSTNT